MKRRDFSAQLGLGALALGTVGLGAAGPAAAQGEFVENLQYTRLGQPLPTTAGKIEVIEFFWYGCPHCFSFEPVIGNWAQHLPSDVSLRRVHVAFRENLKVHQKTFYALEALGRETELRPFIFNQIHREHDYLDTEESMTAFLAKHGIDPARFKEAFNAFGVANKCNQATKLSEDYRIDGVPSIGVGGRYLTSPVKASGMARITEAEMGVRALAVTDYLIQRVRKGI